MKFVHLQSLHILNDTEAEVSPRVSQLSTILGHSKFIGNLLRVGHNFDKAFNEFCKIIENLLDLGSACPKTENITDGLILSVSLEFTLCKGYVDRIVTM